MNVVRRTATTAALLALMAVPAQAQTVIDFESLGSACNNVFGNVGTLSGVNFLNQWTCYSFMQVPYNPNSGTNRVYSSRSGTAHSPDASFNFLSPSQFFGAFFSGNGSPVSYQMFLNGLPVASSTVLSTSGTPTFLASGYSGPVDAVLVSGSFGQYVMDDVTYGSVPAAVTPEPASIILLGSGLSALGLKLRRRRRTAGSQA